MSLLVLAYSTSAIKESQRINFVPIS